MLWMHSSGYRCPADGEQRRLQIVSIDVGDHFVIDETREGPGDHARKQRTLIRVAGVQRAPSDACGLGDGLHTGSGITQFEESRDCGLTHREVELFRLCLGGPSTPSRHQPNCTAGAPEAVDTYQVMTRNFAQPPTGVRARQALS